jgi:thioredoxin-like negative regulator of GroEL
MAPHFEAIAEEVGEALIFAKVNTGDVPELARAFNIRSVPTVVALNGSKVVDVHVGGAQPATLRNLAVRTLKKAGQPVPAHLKPAGFIRGLFGG